MMDQFRRFIAPLQRRIMLMVARGLVTAVKDDGKIQKLQLTVLDDEVIDGIDRIQEFGFTSRPAPGAQAVILFLGGNRDHGVVVGTEDGPTRPNDLGEGEAAVYSVGQYQVRVLKDKIQVGKAGTWETMVVGDKLAELLGLLIDDLANHVHGPPGSPPTTKATIATRKSSYVTNGKILAKDGGRF